MSGHFIIPLMIKPAAALALTAENRYAHAEMRRCFLLLIGLSAFSLPVFADQTQTFRWAGFTQAQQLPQNQYRVGLKTFGNWSEGETLGTGSGIFSSYGTVIGIDRQLGKNWLIGLNAGENRATMQSGGNPSAGKSVIESLFGTFYVRKTFSYSYFDVEPHYAHNRNKTSGDADQWGIAGEFGIWRDHGLGKIEPFLRLSHTSIQSGAEMSAGTESLNMLLAGVRYSWRTTSQLSTTVPRFYGGLQHEFGSKNVFQVSPFSTAPSVVVLRNGKTSPSRAFLGGGFTTSMGTSLDILLRYTAEISPHWTSHTVMLGVNCNF